MESFDSSPSRFEAKIESFPGGSECDEINCINSSTCGSSINGPFTPKSSSEIKYKTKNNKNFVSVRSIKRRAKSRAIHTPIDMSDDSLPSDGSPNYLKATSCSKGKSSRDFESRLGRNGSFKTLSRTSSGLRNVRVLIKRSSFKPKRGLMNYSRVSEDVSVNRATYSSTIKGSKIPEPLDHGLKVCRYHHCSLHGGCSGTHDDPVMPLKRFLHKKRRSLKKQRSVIPKPELRIEKKNLKKGLEVSIIESSSFDVENKNGFDSYEAVDDSGIFEIAYGETSFPERSYHDDLNIFKKHEHDFGEIPFGHSGYCLRCSCQTKEQISSSNVGNVYTTDIPHNGSYNDFSGTNSSTLIKKSVEYHGNEAANEVSREIPAIHNEVTENNRVCSSTSYSEPSINDNYEGEDTRVSACIEDSKDNEVTQVTNPETNSRTQEGCTLQFSKPRHISMWNLIHQHMSSDLAVESANTPRDGVDSPVANESSDMGSVNNNSEIQEIEVRKLIAIKLVREAIEKILLPEVQDQTSDDVSITSESTPRSERIETNQSDTYVQENRGESEDVGKEDNDVSSKLDDSSPREKIEETEKLIVGKPEKKSAPKHWSNLKKWILLQRFIKALEKVKKFNPKKPQFLPLNPDPEAEKVNLRPQTVESKKRSEEWMLDYALRQAVGQLAPTQKRKVGLLVRAFETVVPTQVDPPQARLRASRLRGKETHDKLTEEKVNSIPIEGEIKHEDEHEDKETRDKLTDEKVNSIPIVGEIKREDEHEDKETRDKLTDEKFNSIPIEGEIKREDEHEDKETRDKLTEEEVNSIPIEGEIKREDEHEDKETRDKLTDEKVNLIPIDGEIKREDEHEDETSTKTRVKMWHMIYQHVVSGIAEKVGTHLLDGSDEEEEESKSNGVDRLTKSDALKLVKEAMNEIMDDSSDTQSVTSESVLDREISNKGKNWSKLKKLLLVKRSIRALDKARKVKGQFDPSVIQMVGPDEKEKVELRRQMMDEKRKAEQWMLDYAVQHIVTKLTPARKRRVSMLVEAFEAVVPFPEM